MKLIYGLLIACLFAQASAMEFKDDKKTLHIAMSGTTPPWNSRHGGKWVGFEPDLMKQVCFRLNRKCYFYPLDQGRVLTAVRFDRYDIGISGLGVTKDMARVLLTSQSYGKKGYVLVTKKHSFLASDFCDGTLKPVCGKPFDVSDFDDAKRTHLQTVSAQLQGHMVGIQVGTVEEWLSKLLNGVNTQKASTQQELLKMMKNREVNTVILSNEYWHHLSKLPEYQVYGAIGPVFYGGHLDSKVAAVGKKDNPELIESVNEILDEMREDGTLATLSEKWFGQDITQ